MDISVFKVFLPLFKTANASNMPSTISIKSIVGLDKLRRKYYKRYFCASICQDICSFICNPPGAFSSSWHPLRVFIKARRREKGDGTIRLPVLFIVFVTGPF
jgi:hypothetical protein